MPNFQIPTNVQLDEDSATDTFARYIYEPLERGYGVTVGNAFRRILMSSIPGAAITAIKVDGVHHEFTTIEGVKEDVSEIILNLKQVKIRLGDTKHEKVSLHIEGAGELKAGEIGEGQGDFEIMNPDHHIFTMNEDADFNLEVMLGRGRGYVPAEKNKLPEAPIGMIFVDSIFSPVTNANYKVEELQTAEKANMERLTLEITTDGSIEPANALGYAAQLLRDHINPFLQFESGEIKEPEKKIDEEVLRVRKQLQRSIDELELSVRAYNCLKFANIETIADLVEKEESEMLKYKNFGKKSLQELVEKLGDLGLEFGMDVDKYTKDQLV
ncbi:MAG: DNA-directed RNA polymerase subunit alpha [Candidatus Marinimicrobia bacterium]|nr:DNA-directed RNA polymerase subunit alpha [Candidatus Neomarinimicrobiota bacterium]MCF7827499.1 DNA-directed RNA polymerase subunit alpha [Candidatus Neomarinimicrobiota bacterium]MCF7882371.1 DNA-directed RNA polymerase subunit alpha [Candidatus Neomarinimicrobiota bacterium]